MAFEISVLLFTVLTIIVLPFERLFPKRNLKKLIILLNQGDFETKIKNETYIDKFFLLGEKIYKILKLKISTTKYNKYKNQIILAGASEKLSVESFYGIKLLLAFIMVSYTLIAFLINGSLLLFLIVLLSPLIAFYFPDSVLKSKIRKRQWQMQTELPNILNTLAIITDAGLSFFEAVKKVCEVRKGYLVDELNKVIDEVNLGMMQRDALLRMADRCQVNEISIFVFTVVQSLEKGASGITLVLKEQAKEIWDKRKNKAKELGEQASIKLFLPMLLMVFPCLMIFLLGPAVIAILKILKFGG